jgi:hypothetical protein
MGHDSNQFALKLIIPWNGAEWMRNEELSEIEG